MEYFKLESVETVLYNVKNFCTWPSKELPWICMSRQMFTLGH